jgi:type I restriction enzyme S subunit
MSETILENSNELPSSWSTIILQDYVTIAARIGWRGLKKSEYTNSGAFLLAVKDIEDDGRINFSGIQDHLSDFRYNESPEIQLKENDILITKDGTIGKIGFITKLPKKTTVNSSILVVRPLNFVYPRYLFYYFKSPFFQKIVKEKIKGTAVPHLFQYDIKNFKIHVAPLNEQKRIVVKIEELFSKLDFAKQSLEKTKNLLKQYRQSLLKSAFEGKLTEKWREQNKDSLEPASVLLEKIRRQNGLKKTESGMSELVLEKNEKLPEKWIEVTVKELFKIIDYRGRTPPYEENGIPHLRSSNIKNGKIIWEDLKFVSSSTYKKFMTRGIPQKGDILFTTEAPIGEVALAPAQKFSLAQRLLILRPPSEVDSKFILYQIMSPNFKEQLAGKKTGTTVTGVSSRNFKPSKIFLASSNEQKQIVAKIEEGFSLIENNERIIESSLKNIDSLRQSILKQAFEGKLVPQDPNDEPASVLLEKIRQEKQKIISQTTKRKKNGK